MSYMTGSVTDANPGPALYAALAPALTSAGFTLVDTVTIGGRTHQVWKSAATSNSLNLDWYLDIGYTTAGAATFTMQPFEFYDPATDLGYRGVFTGASTTAIDPTTSTRFGATGSALETNWIGATTFNVYTTPLTTGAFGYWFSATPDRVILLQSNDATSVTYVGFYQPDPLYAAKVGASLYPLVGMRLPNSGAGSWTSTAASYGNVTRVPPATALAGQGWGATLAVPTLATEARTGLPALPSGATAGYPFVAYPVELFSGNAFPARYGTFRDVAQVPASTAARGDTVTIGGVTWVLSSPSNNQSLLLKAV